MSLNQALAVLAVAAVSASAFPTGRAAEECENKLQRRAWHTLADEEKAEYIKAEQCLMGLEATAGLPVSRSKFDELQENHQIQATVVHQVVCLDVSIHWQCIKLGVSCVDLGRFSSVPSLLDVGS